jgi:7-carboxy-7-deazaguanine synthase
MSSPQTRRQSQKTANKTLRINEIFYSLQGEARHTGLPTVFIRLAGCPYRCVYCDSAYAFYDGNTLCIDDIIQTISRYRTQYVTVTGGEPLAQKSCLDLLIRLCDEGFMASLETSGALDLSRVDERVTKIVDIKTPGSGEADKNRFDNLEHLNSSDQIKFVICDRDDYNWAKQKLYDFILHDRCEILFSPSYDQLATATLADWILEDRLPVRFQMQLHKYLWGDIPGK